MLKAIKIFLCGGRTKKCKQDFKKVLQEMADLKQMLIDVSAKVSGDIAAVSAKIDTLGGSGIPEGATVFTVDEADQAAALLQTLSDESGALKDKADAK